MRRKLLIGPNGYAEIRRDGPRAWLRFVRVDDGTEYVSQEFDWPHGMLVFRPRTQK